MIRRKREKSETKLSLQCQIQLCHCIMERPIHNVKAESEFVLLLSKYALCCFLGEYQAKAVALLKEFEPGDYPWVRMSLCDVSSALNAWHTGICLLCGH